MATVAQLEAKVAQLEGIARQLELERDHKDTLLAAANSQVGALTHDVLEPLRAEFAALQKRLEEAPSGSRRVKTIVFDDGERQEVA